MRRSILAGVAAVGCGSFDPALRTAAAATLDCPAAEIRLRRRPGSAISTEHVAKGCGRREVMHYWCMGYADPRPPICHWRPVELRASASS